MRKCIAFAALIFMILACTPKPEAINYGQDQCHYCKMSLADEKYATEVVTAKGKIYKYDDVSCMVKHINELEQQGTKLAYTIVNNFDKPAEFLNVEDAIFISSENFTSPMGGNTAAFRSAEKAADPNYTISNWSGVKEKFSK